jgi:hypothetical protein
MQVFTKSLTGRTPLDYDASVDLNLEPVMTDAEYAELLKRWVLEQARKS